MDQEEKTSLIARYQQRLDQHGYSPKSLGWGRSGSQGLRFSILAADALAQPGCSVLDVGCGFADLYDHLRQGGWRGRYVGLDLVPGFIEAGRQRHPELELHCGDLDELGPDFGPFDQVIASGVFNVRPANQGADEHLRQAMARLFGLCSGTLCLDFLSDQVDFQQPKAYHPGPVKALELALELTKRVRLRHDYMPYEFAVFLYRDQEKTDRNVFRGHRA